MNFCNWHTQWQKFEIFWYNRSLSYRKEENHFAYHPANSLDLEIWYFVSFTYKQALQRLADALIIGELMDASINAFDSSKAIILDTVGTTLPNSIEESLETRERNR